MTDEKNMISGRFEVSGQVERYRKLSGRVRSRTVVVVNAHLSVSSQTTVISDQ